MDTLPPELFFVILSYCEEYYPAIMSVCSAWRFRVIKALHHGYLQTIPYETIIKRGQFSLATWARPNVCQTLVALNGARDYASLIHYTHAWLFLVIKHLMDRPHSIDVARVIYVVFKADIENARVVARIFIQYLGRADDILASAVLINDLDFIVFLHSVGCCGFVAASAVASAAGNKIMSAFCMRVAVGNLQLS